MANDLAGGLEKDAADLKKRIKAARTGHDLHVGVLMHKLGLSKADASVLAYLDGHQGLDGRLQTKEPKLI